MDNDFIQIDDVYRAVDAGHADRLDHMLSQQHQWASFEKTLLDDHGLRQVMQTAIILAIQEKQNHLLQPLLDHVPSDTDMSGVALIAVRRQRIDQLRVIVNHCIQKEMVGPSWHEALEEAATTGQTEYVRLLIDAGVQPEHGGMDFVFRTIQEGHHQVMSLLLTLPAVAAQREQFLIQVLSTGRRAHEHMAHVLYEFEACENAIERFKTLMTSSKMQIFNHDFDDHVLMVMHEAHKQQRVLSDEINSDVLPNNKRKM